MNYVWKSGKAGTNDNDVVYISGEIGDFTRHYIEATAGTVDVDVTLDGTNWIQGVAGRDVTGTTATTLAVTAASGTMLEIIGRFRGLRVLQNGATASNARVAHGK